VFCLVDVDYVYYAHLNPLATFIESEGLTIVVPIEAVKKAQLANESRFKQITLTVHTSLDVGKLILMLLDEILAYIKTVPGKGMVNLWRL